MSSELRWQVFFSVWTRFHRLVIFGPTESFRCHRNIPLGATDFATGKTVCHLFYISSDPALLNESCPLQASQFYPLLCAESQGPNLYDGFQKALLGNWCQRGRERSHQSLSFRERSHQRISLPQGEREISRGRKYSSRKYFSRIPDAWCSRGEMPHVFLRGKTCSYVLICISSVLLYLSALIFCSLSSPSIPC